MVVRTEEWRRRKKAERKIQWEKGNQEETKQEEWQKKGKKWLDWTRKVSKEQDGNKVPLYIHKTCAFRFKLSFAKFSFEIKSRLTQQDLKFQFLLSVNYKNTTQRISVKSSTNTLTLSPTNQGKRSGEKKKGGGGSIATPACVSSYSQFHLNLLNWKWEYASWAVLEKQPLAAVCTVCKIWNKPVQKIRVTVKPITEKGQGR